MSDSAITTGILLDKQTGKGPVRVKGGNKPFVICFFGTDGSGKSTLSKILLKELMQQNLNASSLWWLEGENSLFRRVIRVSGNNEVLSERDELSETKKGNIFKSLFSVVYPRLVLLDYALFGIRNVWIPKKFGQRDVMIFDRYIHDVVFSLSKEFHFSTEKRTKIMSLFSRIIPDPDLIFLISAPPEILYQRKRDELESVENARRKWNDFQRFQDFLLNNVSSSIVFIDNSKPLRVVRNKICNTALDSLNQSSGVV
jgi:thymidylate kinase